jgi:hypothetical protein
MECDKPERCATTMIRNFLEEKRFAKFWELPGFKSLKSEYMV